MANTPKKVAVIGLDCALPHLIEKHVAEGHLPTFKRLIEGGVIADNCLVPYPTITPPNWATIATGAWPGTHQITDFHVHPTGTSLDYAEEAFSSERVKAEFIWDAADKAGKRCIVLNYPGSWPSHMKNGIMVGGAGLCVGDWRDGYEKLDSRFSMCIDQLITTGLYPNALRGEFRPARDWANAADMGEDPLEMEVAIKFPGAKHKPPRVNWHVLVRQTGVDGYDQATLSRGKDLKDAFCTLSVGQWSPVIHTGIDMGDGSQREVVFRAKLIELTEDAGEFRLILSTMQETSGWSDPPAVAQEIASPEGVHIMAGGLIGYPIGWIDLDTYAEMGAIHDEWLGDAAASLLRKHDWDLFYMHSHPPDWLYHVLITDLDPNTCRDDAKREKAWQIHLKIYQGQDRMIAKILEAAGEDVLFVLVSDHGATADGPTFDPYQALVPAGLTVLQEHETYSEIRRVAGIERTTARRPDHGQSKAIAQRSCYVYVNLKGRDPQGIVDPEDYEKVQQEIVDALLTHVDAETGRRPVALALRKDDARILGLHGEGIGDVVYALYPWFGHQHGQALPTAEWGIGSLKGLLVLNGPGIRKGCRLDRTVGLQDLVPTICYLSDLPVPEQAEGGVVYQAFEDPDFLQKRVRALKDGLGRMEAALASGRDQEE